MLIRGAPGSGPALPELSRRFRWVIVVAVIAFGALIFRLWQLMLVRGDSYYQQTLSNVVHKQALPSIRGKILDRRGVALADNRPAFNIYVTPYEFDETSASRLERILGLGQDEVSRVQERVDAAKKRGAYRSEVLVLEDQPRDRAALIEQAGYQLRGVSVHDEPYRYYPKGGLAAHLLGYMNQLNNEELKEYEPLGYQDADLIGRYGLEREWENYLRGKKGLEKYAEDAKGRRLSAAEAADLIEGPAIIEPVAGHNVVLTLDAELQELAEKAARPHPAAAIAVVEVDTGRILALVSKPSFDPNVMTGHLTRAEEALLLADPRKPFVDKTLRTHYPPGSTYKFVTAIAALEDHQVSPEEILFCPGYHEVGGQRFRCTSSHGKVDMRQAVQQSCNVYFWKLAERIGIDRMAEVALDFGFGTRTGLGLNGDVPGRVPTRAWYEQQTNFKIGYTINAATGQGDVEVGILQLAMAYGALANGGTLYVPQVVRRVETAGGEVVASYDPKVRRKVAVSPNTLDILHDGMWMVVNQLGGTAFTYAHSELIEYAGKTGTAQVRRKRRGQEVEIEGWHPHRDHAWFAGYAPAKNPEIAIVVLIEHGGPGGKVAGPVAQEILEGYFTTVKPATLGTPPPVIRGEEATP